MSKVHQNDCYIIRGYAMWKYSYFTFSGTGKEEYKYITVKKITSGSVHITVVVVVTRRYDSWIAVAKVQVSQDSACMLTNRELITKKT